MLVPMASRAGLQPWGSLRGPWKQGWVPCNTALPRLCLSAGLNEDKERAAQTQCWGQPGPRKQLGKQASGWERREGLRGSPLCFSQGCCIRSGHPYRRAPLRHPPLPAPWCHWAAFCAGVAERHIQPRAYCRPRALPLGCAQGCSPKSGFPIQRGPPRCPGARRIPGLLPGEENHERGTGPAAKQPPASWPAPAAGAGSTADLPSTPPCPGCANTASIPPPPSQPCAVHCHIRAPPSPKSCPSNGMICSGTKRSAAPSPTPAKPVEMCACRSGFTSTPSTRIRDCCFSPQFPRLDRPRGWFWGTGDEDQSFAWRWGGCFPGVWLGSTAGCCLLLQGAFAPCFI